MTKNLREFHFKGGFPKGIICHIYCAVLFCWISIRVEMCVCVFNRIIQHKIQLKESNKKSIALITIRKLITREHKYSDTSMNKCVSTDMLIQRNKRHKIQLKIKVNKKYKVRALQFTHRSLKRYIQITRSYDYTHHKQTAIQNNIRKTKA